MNVRMFTTMRNGMKFYVVANLNRTYFVSLIKHEAKRELAFFTGRRMAKARRTIVNKLNAA